jgi:hypothetical protein
MPHKADPTVICQCGAIISKCYMQKHLHTRKHTRDMVGRENIEVADACIRMYVCMYIIRPNQSTHSVLTL